MTHNRALWRSIHFLGQPYSLAALALLFLNDALLRRLWPSALTGKLSDLAWLFVAPAALTVVLALLAPGGLRRREGWIAGMGFGLTAVGFALLKTVAPFRDAVLQIWQAGLGFPAAVLIDPTDLAALASLAAAAFMWTRQRAERDDRPLRAGVALALLSLLTLADAAAPEMGLTCLEQQGRQVIAHAAFHSFVSTDGGLTWEMDANMQPQHCSQDPQAEIALGSAGLRFRYTPGQVIESSSDGKTWNEAYRLAPMSQAAQAYAKKVSPGNLLIQPGPLYALADPSSGNLIFAMGLEGILVRQANGTWTWVTVTSFHRQEALGSAAIFDLLNGELMLAGALGLFVLALGAFARKRNLLWTLLVLVAWLGWLALLLLFPPAVTAGYIAAVSMLGSLFLLVLAALVGLPGAVMAIRASIGKFLGLLVLGLAASGLFCLPFYLWFNNQITDYMTADAIGIGVGVAAGLIGLAVVKLGKR